MCVYVCERHRQGQMSWAGTGGAQGADEVSWGMSPNMQEK